MYLTCDVQKFGFLSERWRRENITSEAGVWDKRGHEASTATVRAGVILISQFRKDQEMFVHVQREGQAEPTPLSRHLKNGSARLSKVVTEPYLGIHANNTR